MFAFAAAAAVPARRARVALSPVRAVRAVRAVRMVAPAAAPAVVPAVAAPGAPPAPAQVVLVKAPPAALEAAVALGEMKARQGAAKVLLLGFAAGAYIALGALLALCVGGAVPGVQMANVGMQKLLFGAFGLPLGLTMVCTAGGELFTGNTALCTTALLRGRVDVAQVLRNWVASFVGNFAGSLFVVYLALATGCLAGPSVTAAVAIATAKSTLPFGTAFARGVACNWLVCMGVYLSTACSDFSGKFLAIWLPVSAFVAMGFDHSIANMFLIPMGRALGAKVTLKAFLLGNLLPVTLGNIVGGAGLVGLLYYLAYGRSAK